MLKPKSPFIPLALKRRPQWVVVRQGVPYQPGDPRKKARVNDPTTWGRFAQAVAAYREGEFDGVAFVFSADDPFVGIDLDACRNPKTGKRTAWASEIVRELDGYTEISPSGTGLHIIVRGDFPGTKQRPVRKLRDVKSYGDKQPEIMLCRSGGMLTLTGRRLKGRTKIRKRLRALHALYQKFFDSQAAESSRPSAPQSSTPVDEKLLERLVEECRTADDRSAADFHVCCTSIRHGWDPEAVWERVRDESKFAERGRDYFDSTWGNAQQAVSHGLTNATPAGRGRLRAIPLPRILELVYALTGSWPRRVNGSLFIDDPQHGISFLRSPAALFGWLQAVVENVRWHGCNSCVTKEEVFQELLRTAHKYAGIQELPHEPPLEGYYYACRPFKPGDGQTLEQLIDRFTPATDLDRQLILSLFVTAMWGGPPGARPMFVITADGRGHGKTSLVTLLGTLYDGCLSCRRNEDAGIIAQRLLSPEGMTRRIVLLDNLKSRNFSWAELESLITTPTISGKRMYVGEGSRPNHLVYVVTANAASFSTDVAQRAVIVKLGKPRHSGTWQAETQQFIEEHRDALIADIIGFLRGPARKLKRYTRWADWERAVLARLPQPVKLQKLIRQRQGEVDVEQETARLVEDYVWKRLAFFQFDPATQRIRIPSEQLVEWFNEATGRRESVAAASSTLRQMGDEGQLQHLRKAKSHKGRRSFFWTGEDWKDSLTVDFRQENSRKEAEMRRGGTYGGRIGDGRTVPRTRSNESHTYRREETSGDTGGRGGRSPPDLEGAESNKRHLSPLNHVALRALHNGRGTVPIRPPRPLSTWTLEP